MMLVKMTSKANPFVTRQKQSQMAQSQKYFAATEKLVNNIFLMIENGKAARVDHGVDTGKTFEEFLTDELREWALNKDD